MKAKIIVIFIFGVLAGLALICAVFPPEGITIGNIKFDFPSLHEALSVRSATDTQSGDSTDVVPTDPEELFEYQLKNMNTNDQKAFMEFCQSNPARFHVPDSDLTYFDDLFEAMENATVEPMRILHYGDSQLEGDRISADFRERLQTAFGGSGVGAMTVVQTASPQLQRYFSYNMGDHLTNGRYGIMSQVAHLNGSVTMSFRSSSLEGVPHSKTYSKITLVCCGNGRASVNAAGTKLDMTDNTGGIDGMKFLTATLPSPQNRVTVNASGNMEIFGVMLDGKNGISLDNVPMRGCSGTVFTITDRKTLEPFFKHSNVRLIILQYGGNSVPYMNREKQIQGYKNGLIAQVNLFKKIAPDAKILFIGPADMATNVKGEKQTYPQLEPTIKIIEEVCNETGIAFWNLYDAMGGRNSMVKWVNANLAGKDYLHFTRDGASKVADMLFNTYLMYYRFYCKRVGKTPKSFESKPDTVGASQ